MKCMNCGSDFETPYCGQCGQQAYSARVTPTELKRGFQQSFSLERGWIHTLVDLTLRPGTMVGNYLAGKRVIYIGPFKYAVTIVGVYVLAITVFGVTTSGGETYALIMKEFMQRFGQPLVLLLCPIRAGITWVLFRNRGLTFSEHLTMTLYVVGQFMLAYIIVLAALRLFPSLMLPIVVIEYSILVGYYAWVLRSVCARSPWSALGVALLAEIVAQVVLMAIMIPAAIAYILLTRGL